MLRCLLLATFVLTAASAALADPPAENAAAQPPQPLDPADVDFFETKIRPVLVAHCYQCHSADAQEVQAGLVLDRRAGLLKGGDSGPALTPGQPDKSLLIEALRYDGQTQMPPAGKLDDNVLRDFEEWVRRGAPDPRSAGLEQLAIETVWERAAKHWAFQPPRIPPPPTVQQADWPRQQLDHYLLAEIEAAGLTPSPAAPPATLVRRLYFDLIGLPPTYEDIQRFASDDRPQAYEELVDELLARPQFGERWARHWLDVARYADTKGYVFREERDYKEAYRYRDWVVAALNSDLPYDRFLQLQLAADRLAPDQPGEQVAMGFLTLGRRFLNNRHDIIDDRIDVVMRGTLGLTVACARCHDHKFDPIPIDDYYALYGVFNSSDEPKEGAPLRLVDAEKPADVRIFLRGNPANRGEPAPRRFLRVLAGADAPRFTNGSGRLELARAIASNENPLTARIMVNRVWGRLFKKPLVDTPSDFGLRTAPPRHQNALDYLSATFMEDDWSVKRLIRRIVLSAAYRQASDDRPAAAAVDPENLLVWRMNRQRLEVEALRDGMLAASARLDPAVGGPAAPLTSLPFSNRRTLYGYIDRQNLPGMFRAFDFANPDTHAPQRYETTVPQQALFLLNAPFVLELAQALAARSATSDGVDNVSVEGAPPGPDHSPDDPVEARIVRLYRQALSRDPDADERQLGRQFLAAAATLDDEVPTSAAGWQYGYARFDQAAGRLADYRPLPHWTGARWQGGDKLPDAQLGWAMLDANGGHPGRQFAAVRRWVAPADGWLAVDGTLKHPSGEGDGVRGAVVGPDGQAVAHWDAHNSEAKTTVPRIEVRAGQSVDLVVACRDNENHDSFRWTAAIQWHPAAAGSAASVAQSSASQPSKRRWESAADFAGPAPRPLSAWERYAQALILSNEFTFID